MIPTTKRFDPNLFSRRSVHLPVPPYTPTQSSSFYFETCLGIDFVVLHGGNVEAWHGELGHESHHFDLESGDLYTQYKHNTFKLENLTQSQ